MDGPAAKNAPALAMDADSGRWHYRGNSDIYKKDKSTSYIPEFPATKTIISFQLLAQEKSYFLSVEPIINFNHF